jgi:PAS domain-containing protein
MPKKHANVNPINNIFAKSKSTDEEDENDHMSAKRPIQLRITYVDGVLAIFSILLIAAALGGSLGGFFSLQMNEQIAAQNALNSTVVLQQLNIQRILTGLLQRINTLTGYYSVAGTTNYYTQTTPFVNISNLFMDGIYTLGLVAIVPNYEVNDFLQSIRSIGKDFTNFTLTNRDANNNVIPAAPESVYYPYIQAFPYSHLAGNLGFDVGSESIRRSALLKSIATVMPASTSRIFIASRVGEISPGAIIYQAYTNDSNPSQVIGLTFGSVVFSLFMPVALTTMSSNLDKIIVTAFDVTDANATTLLYSTVTEQQLAQFGINTELSNISATEMLTIHNNAPFKLFTSAQFADRSWQISFAATNSYIESYRTNEKWIALFIPLLFTMVLVSIIILFSKGLQFSFFLRQVSKERVRLLENNQHRLTTLLDKISLQEQKTRSTIDAIPDFLVVISATGRIVRTNNSFDRVFCFQDNDMEKGVYVSTIFRSLEPLFFTKMSTIDTIETEATTRFGKIIPVQVSANLVTPSVLIRENSTLDDKEEAYIIVAKNMTDREKLLEDLRHQENNSKSMMKFVAFDAQFAIESVRKALLEFSRKEHSSESVLFLIEIQQYRQSPTDKRVEMQGEIYAKFISKEGRKQLNISSELAAQTASKVSKSLGDIDVFCDIEDAVKTMILLDLYPRFLKEQEKLNFTHSDNSLSSTDEISQREK